MLKPYNKNRLFQYSLAILITGCATFNANAKSSAALLDANGQPLSLETLELLSSASSKFSPSAKADKIPKDKKGTKGIKLKAKKPFKSSRAMEQELFEALKAGKIANVKHLLKKGVKPKYKDEFGTTPLRLAVTKGWASMVVELIEYGADPYEKGRKGLNLLHTAAARGLIDVAKVLVRAGISPSKKTKTGWTPLHVSARYGHWQLVQYFLQQGVDPNAKNKDGRTALGLAINLRHQGVVKILSQVTSVRSSDQIRMAKLQTLRAKNREKQRAKRERVNEILAKKRSKQK